MRTLLTILCFIALQAQGQALFHAHNKVSTAGPVLATSADPDVTKWIIATQLTTQSIANAITTAVTDMKSEGVWALMDFIYPMDGDGINKSYLEQMRYNLKDTATLKLSARLTPTASATGLTPYGSNWVYQTTDASTFMEGEDNHLSLYSRTQSTRERYDMGYTSGSTLALALRWSTSNDAYFSNYGGFGSGPTNTTSEGFFLISRTSSSTMEYYKNGSLGVSRGASVNAVGSGYITIGGKGSITVESLEGDVATGREYAWASGGRGLTAAQVTAYSTIVNTYQTARSRNVY